MQIWQTQAVLPDLYELDAALAQHQEWGPVAIAYAGPFKPDALGSRAIPFDARSKQSSLADFSHIAISANLLAGEPPWELGAKPRIDRTTDLYKFFSQRKPVDHLDNSMWLFEVAPFLELNLTRTSSENVALSGVRIPHEQIRKIVAVIRDAENDGISARCHQLLLGSLGDPELLDPNVSVEAFRALTDERRAKAAFGQSPFVRTRYGLRYRLAGVDGNGKFVESHRDQCLATFGELRFSLDSPIILESGMFHLRDLLNESIANFSLDQKEVCWTALAYARYLPPAQSWTDRFGRTTAFCELLHHLLRSGYRRQSCAGLHVLQAVMEIVTADRRYGILDRASRIDARDFLRDALSEALVNQRADGSWAHAWHRSLKTNASKPVSLEAQFVVTGHMLELLRSFPEDVSSEVRPRAAKWLTARLIGLAAGQGTPSVCPLTHALRAVSVSNRNAFQSGPPE